MATGASTADVAIVLVDARHGLTAQSRRHAYIAWLLGIRRLVIAVNKMDLVGFDPQVFENVRAMWQELAERLPGACFDVLPVSALTGDNVTSRSPRTPWYEGPSPAGIAGDDRRSCLGYDGPAAPCGPVRDPS